MALYYDAASVLSSEGGQGSLKSRIYGPSTVKSNPTQIYALISETAKRDVFLKDVLDRAGLLQDEPKLTPLLALLLCHDHFFSKAGIAAPVKHPLRQSIERHKARLQSEFTRARLRRKCASVDALKSSLDRERAGLARPHPRWARVNTLVDQDVEAMFASLPGCKRKLRLDDVLKVDQGTRSYCYDEHVPNLLAFSPGVDLTKANAYRQGELILQDKASCFPAYLLLGNESKENIGDVIDGCAAPGNKTTHLAAIICETGCTGKIIACERDGIRSKTLQSMVEKANADSVQVLAKQDFLALDPADARFKGVTHLLLDPSCSGSGILGREDIPKLALPEDPRMTTKPTTNEQPGSKSKKRKRGQGQPEGPSLEEEPVATTGNPAADEEEAPTPATGERLQKLSNLQTRIVEHAMKFPAARRIAYSTCSLHEQENEVVVSRLLASQIAQTHGWKVLPRSQQVDGMQRWKHRGVRSKPDDVDEQNKLNQEELDACIRCNPGDEEGTMGFFVCAFVRDVDSGEDSRGSNGSGARNGDASGGDGEEAWEGFD
ncbi:hypothetical protein PMZ80_002311 [Knufia obscura]|uniref:SAM-dependent MTase RsmB/NOP-type domain-containing protein n=1 Tax=Knufia obscura TaxID=1635080 RepID=A0ABR0RWY9_9EURO|nr:hypothetical protein PMZ80_002311 [Knufia obscura]